MSKWTLARPVGKLSGKDGVEVVQTQYQMGLGVDGDGGS